MLSRSTERLAAGAELRIDDDAWSLRVGEERDGAAAVMPTPDDDGLLPDGALGGPTDGLAGARVVLRGNVGEPRPSIELVSRGGRTHAFAASTRMERPEQDWLVYVINSHVDRIQERRRVIAEEFE